MNVAHVATATVLGGLCAWERRAFVQSLVSRPLVASCAMGLALGDGQTGLYVGLFLELFFLGKASLGAALPDHEVLAATAVTSAAIGMAGQQPGSPALWALSVLLFSGTAPVGRKVERWLDGVSEKLVAQALVQVEKGQFRAALRKHLWAMVPQFLAFALLTGVCAAAGQGLSPWVQTLPPKALDALSFLFPLLLSVASAMAIVGTHAVSAWRYALAGAGLVTSLGLLLPGGVGHGL